MDVTAWMGAHGHEQVVFVADASVGLQAVIAVHSTALGPSLGGVRFWRYDDEEEAVEDVLRLSEAMTLKAAAAGLHQGGGKAVVRWAEPGRARSPEFPSALGGVVDEETVDRLRCEIVCGGANNQLASAEMDDALAVRGILYAPDFVANAGGILNIAEEFTGYSRERALASTGRIGERMTEVFAESRRGGIAPGRAAERLARRRLEAEALPNGRWQPGDPAAWTNGQPLTRLRPGS